MSATLLKERVTVEIVALLNANAEKMLNLRYAPAQGAINNGSMIGVLPATTAEHIGLQAAELNAERRALMQAVAVLEEQHKELIAPDGPVPEAEKQNGAERIEPVY